MSSPTFTQTIPILRIFDVAKAREFYLDFLGFTLDWEHRFEPDLPVYMQVSRGGLVLHLSEHHGDCCPGSAVFVRIQGIEEFHRELIDKRYNYNRPGIGMAPWNARCMEVVDPFGNRPRFNEYVAASQPRRRDRRNPSNPRRHSPTWPRGATVPAPRWPM